MAAVGGGALFHVGVHAEKDCMVVGILESDDVYVGAERDLVYEVQLERTDSAFLDFLLGKAVHDPVHVAAVVNMVVDVEVAVAGVFRIN